MNREDMKQILSNIYALQVKGMQMQCPCCGNEMRVDISENSLSRYHEVYICSRCGSFWCYSSGGLGGNQEHRERSQNH